MAKKQKLSTCKNCNTEVLAGTKVCSACGAKVKKPFYKRGWFIALVIIGVIGVGTSGGDDSSNGSDTSQETVTSESTNTSVAETKVEVTVVDFSTMEQSEIQSWGDANNVNIAFSKEYSDTIETGLFVEQSVTYGNTVSEGAEITIAFSLGEEPSTEYKNALSKAEMYSEMMNMSKQGIYDQLTSDYAEMYGKTLPVFEEMSSIKFKGRRETFKASHDSELRQYYMAKRKLTPYFTETGKLPLKSWRNEQDQLRQEQAQDYEAYKPLREELTQLLKVRHCTEIAQRDQPHIEPQNRDQHDR